MLAFDISGKVHERRESESAGERTPRGPRTLHARNLHAREPGDPILARRLQSRRWAAQGRLRLQAGDSRGWEVRSPRTTDEASERGRCRGGGGGKGADQREHGQNHRLRTQGRALAMSEEAQRRQILNLLAVD